MIDLLILFHFDFSKLYTLTKLATYTFTFRYSLASRVFPNPKYYVVYTVFPLESKFHFSKFIFIYRHLKFKETEYFIHDIKFEMYTTLFYVNSVYFQQWNSIYP